MMAQMFHVFVEGAADGTAEGAQRLAEAIASHYGLPAADMLARLRSGRFRVKGNVDRATAESYVRDLERLGARCTIEEANAANSLPTPVPGTLQRPAAAPSRPSGSALPSRPSPSSALAGAPPSRPSTPPSALADAPPSRPSAPPSALAGYARPATPLPAAGAYQSGLAAAFTPEAASSSGGLGALERDDATFSLASVDGGDDAPNEIEKSPELAFGVPASIGPAVARASEPKKPRPKDVPVDMFAPPDAESDDLKVDIAADEQELTRKKLTAAPPLRASQPAIAQPPPVTVKPSKLGPLADERVRMIAGVVLAILIGFLPAHLVARSREASAYHQIDTELVSLQAQAETPEAWEQLDHTRASFLERKKDERRNIALMALVIWALVAGGLGYAWFRKIPWDEL
jgi:hypothetical protein